MMKTTLKSVSTTHLFIILLVILLSLPRLLALDTFITEDEYLWISRSRRFLLALTEGNWANTFQTGHPGVTTMWLGSLGLWTYNHFMTSTPLPETLIKLDWCNLSLDLLPFIRLPVAITTFICILITAKLTAILYNKQVALLTLVLLALNPFYLAHARVLHHDALVSSFMLVSALSMLVYILRIPNYPYLLLSGVSAGLALLSKTTSLFLFPFVGLIFVTIIIQQRHESIVVVKKIIPAGLLWLIFVSLTIYDVWPAMWLSTAQTVGLMKNMLQTYANNPHQEGVFFWGESTQNPSILYYVFTILFQMPPITVIGIGAVISMVVSHFWKQPLEKTGFTTICLQICYIVAFIISLNFGEKKQLRYVLPAMLMLDVIAAWGLHELLTRIISKYLRLHFSAYLIIITIILAIITLPHHPYYLTYYNPLMGGGNIATKMITVGWGEGLDEAARYLNTLPHAEKLQVATWLAVPFAPYFKGNTLFYLDDSALALASDYVVLYRSEIQRNYPNPELQTYLRTHNTLNKVIQVHGIDYAWVYQMQPITPVHGEGMLGYRFSAAEINAGQALTMTIYTQGLYNTEPLVIQMLDRQGVMAFETEIALDKSSDDHIRASQHEIIIPKTISTGIYCPEILPHAKAFEAEISGQCSQYRPQTHQNCVQIYQGDK